MSNRAVTVLSLLAANDRFGTAEVRRTVLMKQAFLADTIRPLYNQWRQIFAFVRYFYGPYSDQVFQGLDTLIFNGLATVVDAERRGGRLEARYKITMAGHDALSKISAREVPDLSMDLVWALQALGVSRATDICKLVYQEPEFSRVFSESIRDAIAPTARCPLPSVTAAGNQTFIMLSLLEQICGMHAASASRYLPSREVVRIFLDTLADQFRAQRSVTESR